MKYKPAENRKVYNLPKKQKRIRLKRKYILYIFLGWIFLTVFSFLVREYFSNYYFHLNMVDLSIEGKKRIIIFAPHCDDETLSSAGVIQKALQMGVEVKVVVMTNGDGFTRAVGQNLRKVNPTPQDYINFGLSRQRETIHALEDLGLSRDDIIFLGFPDRGLRFLWEKYYNSEKPFYSTLTHADKSPYENSYQRNVEYKGINVVMNIKSIIESFKPELIIYPSSYDQHPDHWATSSFVKFTLTFMNYKCEEWQYLVHRGDWPTPFGKRERMYLVPPFKLAWTDTKWFQFPLNDDMILKKNDAIYDYNTQMRVMKSFLEAFIRQNELFAVEKGIIATRYQQENLFQDKFQIAKEPTHDAIPLIFEKGADIEGIFASHDDNKYYFGIKMSGSTKRFVSYYIHLRLFKDNKYLGRAFIQATPKKVSIVKTMTDAGFSLKNAKVYRKGAKMQLIIPKIDLKYSDKILLSIRTEFLGRTLDRSAMKVIEYK